MTALNKVLFPTFGRPTIPAVNIHLSFAYGSAFRLECDDAGVQFEEELARVLPLDIPHRDRLVKKAGQHLSLVALTNEQMNLTRITAPREAAIKHVYDSVAPWRHFLRAKQVLDAGTGAGFPGIPLSIILPDIRFTLAESIQKKARFVDSAVRSLELQNVNVAAERAEDWVAGDRPEIITARAVGPTARLIDLFGKALDKGTCLILYKGPEVESELAEIERQRAHAEVLCRYDLPDDLGTRSLVEIRANRGERARPRRQAGWPVRER